MSEPLFMNPVLQPKIWGGTKLRDIYHYDIPSKHTGECWAISAHPDGVATIENGEYVDIGLDVLFQTHPELFGNPTVSVFPLLTKIIDATDDLSVQVHPDDVYAFEHEGEQGKTECWYVIDADEGAEIVYGHHAKSKEEFADLIEKGEWDTLLRSIKVKAGDFFFVPSGTIHAIGAGIMILETQQSSNTTYRLYDYDRVDDMGKQRELHIQQTLDVSTIPHVDPKNVGHTQEIDDNKITTYIQSDYFNVYLWDVHSTLDFDKVAPYVLVSVLEGDGKLTVDSREYLLTKGRHFILPATVESWSITGNLTCMASTPGPKNR